MQYIFHNVPRDDQKGIRRAEKAVFIGKLGALEVNAEEVLRVGSRFSVDHEAAPVQR